jgi:hypothetical protein
MVYDAWSDGKQGCGLTGLSPVASEDLGAGPAIVCHGMETSVSDGEWPQQFSQSFYVRRTRRRKPEWPASRFQLKKFEFSVPAIYSKSVKFGQLFFEHHLHYRKKAPKNGLQVTNGQYKYKSKTEGDSTTRRRKLCP